MSPTKSVQSDWAAYETAVRAFYAAPAAAARTPRGGVEASFAQIGDPSQAVIASSH